MRVNELRQKSEAELQTSILEFKKELFNLRFQKASGELTKPHRMKYIRRSCAQANTILNEMRNLSNA